MKVPSFPKPDCVYRVLIPFENLKTDQELKVLSVGASSDPRAAGGKGILQIVCTNCIVNLDRTFDADVIKRLPEHLQEVGRFDRKKGTEEFKKYFSKQNRKAKEEEALWKDLIKEDLLKELEAERAANPGKSGKALFKNIRRKKQNAWHP